MARVSLAELKAGRARVNREVLDATTEADIRRHAAEDGQDPDADVSGYRLTPSAADIRRKLGATQEAFATALGVPVATLRNWEQGRKPPDPAARSLLTIMDRDPEAAIRALQGASAVVTEDRILPSGPSRVVIFQCKGQQHMLLVPVEAGTCSGHGGVGEQTWAPKRRMPRNPAKPARGGAA